MQSFGAAQQEQALQHLAHERQPLVVVATRPENVARLIRAEEPAMVCHTGRAAADRSRDLLVAGCHELYQRAPLADHHGLAEGKQREQYFSIWEAGVQLWGHAHALERQTQRSAHRRVPHHGLLAGGHAELAAVECDAAQGDGAFLLKCKHGQVLCQHAVVPAPHVTRSCCRPGSDALERLDSLVCEVQLVRAAGV